MKHTVLSILVLTTLFSSILYAETCNKDMYSITGAISGKFNGKEVSLFLINGDSLLPLSVDTIQNATFSFKGNEYLNNVAKISLCKRYRTFLGSFILGNLRAIAF